MTCLPIHLSSSDLDEGRGRSTNVPVRRERQPADLLGKVKPEGLCAPLDVLAPLLGTLERLLLARGRDATALMSRLALEQQVRVALDVQQLPVCCSLRVVSGKAEKSESVFSAAYKTT